MTRYALIQGGVIAAVVEQGSAPTVTGQWVEVTGAFGPGDTYNGVVFSRATLRPQLTQRAFWRRFLPAERESLQNILATGTQGQKNKLNSFRDYVQTGMLVELDDDYIIASVTLMETAGILAAGRAQVILTAPVTQGERA
jgi:hypothetical protein